MSAGDVIPVPGWSMGGRGQERVEPYPDAQHILRMRRVSESEHADHYLTADEALTAKVRRLKETRTPYGVEGRTVIYIDHNGDVVTLEYLDPEEA